MKRLINRLLVKLGLREPPTFRELYKGPILIPETYPDEQMEKFKKIGWKFTSHYGRLTDDFIVRGEHVRILED